MSFLGKHGGAGSEMEFEGSRGEPQAVPGLCSTWVSPVLCSAYRGSKLGLQLSPIAWSTGYPAGASDLEISFCC